MRAIRYHGTVRSFLVQASDGTGSEVEIAQGVQTMSVSAQDESVSEHPSTSQDVEGSNKPYEPSADGDNNHAQESTAPTAPSRAIPDNPDALIEVITMKKSRTEEGPSFFL